MEAVAVIDFETTGLSPAQGDRATEIAAATRESAGTQPVIGTQIGMEPQCMV